MGSPVAAFVWRDVVGKRWIRCAVWQVALSSAIWLIWECALKFWFRHADAIAPPLFLSVVGAGMRFLLFQASQICFLLGQAFISEPEESDVASFGDVAMELGMRVWRAVAFHEQSTASDVSKIRTKVRTKVDYISFAFLCVASGFLAFISLLSSLLSSVRPNSMDIGLRGVTLGFVYAAVQSYQKKVNLSLPIIQRRLYFSFKMGIPPAVTTSCKLALALLPLGETIAQIFLSGRGVSGASGLMDQRSVLWWQPWFAAVTFVISFCWEVGHLLVQVLQTNLHEFAPSLGSPSAERNPTDLLLMILEDQDSGSLVQCHAFLDLCGISETNVDTWRRAALFEETGDTYRRVINVCLKKLDDLTAILAQGVEVYEADRGMDSLRHQIESPEEENRWFNLQLGEYSSSCQDFQICALCARTVASLTSSSRSEDKYGVAQLHCCNVAVVSSLLSCLLVLEVYLGRRSSSSGVPFVPNSVKWTVPYKGTFMENDKRKFYPLSKRTVVYEKTYALGDVVRTSLYQIVYAFSEEMILGRLSSKGDSLAVRDWVSQKKPLYGTHDMHLQKLIAFLPHQFDLVAPHPY